VIVRESENPGYLPDKSGPTGNFTFLDARFRLLKLTDLPPHIVAGLRALLKGGRVAPDGAVPIVIRRALPQGHVAAVLGVLRQSGLDRLLGGADRFCNLVTAMIVMRLIHPASKLATARMLDGDTAASSLGAVLGLGSISENELYAALDGLLVHQQAIETALARKHLSDGTLVLYDVSSSYLEGRRCALARRGYNRDGKKGKLQIVYGLLCAKDGAPIAVRRGVRRRHRRSFHARCADRQD